MKLYKFSMIRTFFIQVFPSAILKTYKY